MAFVFQPRCDFQASQRRNSGRATGDFAPVAKTNEEKLVRQRFAISVCSAITAAMCLLAGSAAAQESYVIIHDEASITDLLKKLTSGDAKGTVEKKDVYKDDGDAKAALYIDGTGGDGQRFNSNMADWAFKIVKDPKAKDEFRYLTWAWKKLGGTGTQLQLSAGGDWGHRYHAGVNEKAWNPSIEVTPVMPKEWTLVTRDVWQDQKDMNLTGMAFSPASVPGGLWDHMALHKTKDDPLAVLAVQPKGKLAAAWSELKVAR